MFLFTRTVSMTGDPRQCRAAAVATAELVGRKTGLSLSLWSVFQGDALGTLAFTTMVQSMTEFYATTSSLLDDDEYLARLGEMRPLAAGPPVDQALEILHTSGGDYRRAGTGAVASVITAEIGNARFADALDWSVGMADLVADIIGRAVIFGRGVAGGFGSVGWVVTQPDMPTFEAAEEALAKDPRYMTKLDGMGDLFVPGSGRRTLSWRIA